MACKAVVNFWSFLFDQVEIGLMIAYLGTIIKLILVNKLMIRNEMVHGAVPRFRNVVWVPRIALFSISAVNRLFDNSPYQIVV